MKGQSTKRTVTFAPRDISVSSVVMRQTLVDQVNLQGGMAMITATRVYHVSICESVFINVCSDFLVSYTHNPYLESYTFNFVTYIYIFSKSQVPTISM